MDPLPFAVVLFSVTRTITGPVRQIIIQPNSNGGYENGLACLSVNDISGAQRVFINALQGYRQLWLALLAGITLFLAEEFIRVWTRGAVQYNQELGLIFLISIVANVPGWISYNIFQFTNRPTDNRDRKYDLRHWNSGHSALALHKDASVKWCGSWRWPSQNF